MPVTVIHFDGESHDNYHQAAKEADKLVRDNPGMIVLLTTKGSLGQDVVVLIARWNLDADVHDGYFADLGGDGVEFVHLEPATVA